MKAKNSVMYKRECAGNNNELEETQAKLDEK